MFRCVCVCVCVCVCGRGGGGGGGGKGNLKWVRQGPGGADDVDTLFS